MVIARLRQVFRLSAALDNMRLVHEGEKAATQASLIHLADGPRMALLLAEYAKRKKKPNPSAGSGSSGGILAKQSNSLQGTGLSA